MNKLKVMQKLVELNKVFLNRELKFWKTVWGYCYMVFRSQAELEAHAYNLDQWLKKYGSAAEFNRTIQGEV